MTTKTITLCSDYLSSSIHISTKKSKKGIYTRFEYYIGFEKKSIHGYFNEEEIEKVKKDIEKVKNNIFTRLIININELTKDIITHFRYIEPIIEHEKQDLLICPYILGLWLGDGDSVRTALTNIDIPIINAWETYGKELGCRITYSNKKDRKNNIEDGETPFVQSYHIVGVHGSEKGNIFRENLKKYNLIKNKHIPNNYLHNTKENRLKLLAGLIDTDGSLTRGAYEISQKNEQLSNNIIELSRSLGFYTHYSKTEKSCMYKGEKKTGYYYRIIISLNQFSIEIPVLLERKKWKYTEFNKNICNPFIDINGNVLIRTTTKWTDEMKIKLYSITQKIKQIIPDKPIPWNRYGEFDIIFKDCSTGALDTMYNKTLLKEKEKYDKLIIDVNIDLIEPKWMDNYKKIKNMLENGETITADKDKYLYDWINNQNKHNNDIKSDLIDEIKNLNSNINNTSDLIEWKKRLSELCDFMETNKKTPSEGSKIGNFLKGLKRYYNNKQGNVYNDQVKRTLWENVISKYDKIINKHNSSIQIKITSENGNEKLFDSQNDVARHFECSKTTIMSYLKNGKKYKGNKIEQIS